MKRFHELNAATLVSLLLTYAIVAHTLVTHAIVVRADDTQVLDKLDEQLAKLQTYQYGQNGNPLREMEETIFALPPNSPLRGTIEWKLIDALAGANTIGKGVICRQLRVVGTDKCVPAVAPLLVDPELSQFARTTLQGLGSSTALKAMHEALHRTSGAVQAGLLNSLSNRDYAPMREDCVSLLESDDPVVATAAVRALGRLGGTTSVAELTRVRADASKQRARDIDLALLNCAEHLKGGGDGESAATVFRKLYESSPAFRLAGLRGLVLTQPEEAADLLVDATEQNDPRLTNTAIQLTTQVAGGAATAKFVGLLENLSDSGKVLLLKALGVRGDPVAVPAVAQAAGSPDAKLRLAAIEALGGLSGPQALDALLQAAVEGDDPSKQLARASLARVEGVEPRLAEVAQGPKEEHAVEAIRAFAARNARDATALMFRLAKDDSTSKRAAAIEALGVLAGADQVKQLVQLAIEPKAPGDRTAIEPSLGRALMKIELPARRALPLLNALSNAASESRPVLIRQLYRSGSPAALAAVREAIRSSDTATSDAAVAALANWPNDAARGDMIDLIVSARTPALKTLVLNGYLRIASASDDPSAMFLDALKKVSHVDDKKRVLNEIGLNCESLEAIETTRSLLDDPQLSATAAIATIRVAYKLRSSHKNEARTVLNEVLAKVDHPDAQKRAQDVLNDIDKYEDHILKWVAVGPFVDEKILSGRQSYETVFAPEKADVSDLDWKPISLGIGSWSVNLESVYGSLDHCAAYVKTMVWSPIDQDVQVEGGCDDALRIWLNGNLIYDQYSEGAAAPRQRLVPTRLRQGWNELKLKVVDHEGGWVFGCRIRKPDGAKLEGLKYEAR